MVLTGAVVVGGVGTLWRGPTDTIQLESLTPAAQKDFYMRFLKPRAVDFALTSKAEAVKRAEHADPEGLPVREVVLARAHRVDWGPPNDPLCWVVVMTFDQTPPVGVGFIIILVDAHTGNVIWQGPVMGS